jgi:hypothetical protein
MEMFPVCQLAHKIPTEFRRLSEIFYHTSTFLFMYFTIHSEPLTSSVGPWLANALLASDTAIRSADWAV